MKEEIEEENESKMKENAINHENDNNEKWKNTWSEWKMKKANNINEKR